MLDKVCGSCRHGSVPRKPSLPGCPSTQLGMSPRTSWDGYASRQAGTGKAFHSISASPRDIPTWCLLQVEHRLYVARNTASCFSVQIAGFEVLPDAPLRLLEPGDVLELVPRECSTLSNKRQRIDPAAGAVVAQQTSEPALEGRAAPATSSTETSSSSDDDGMSPSEDTPTSEEANPFEKPMLSMPYPDDPPGEWGEVLTSSEEVRRLPSMCGYSMVAIVSRQLRNTLLFELNRTRKRFPTPAVFLKRQKSLLHRARR